MRKPATTRVHRPIATVALDRVSTRASSLASTLASAWASTLALVALPALLAAGLSAAPAAAWADGTLMDKVSGVVSSAMSGSAPDADSESADPQPAPDAAPEAPADPAAIPATDPEPPIPPSTEPSPAGQAQSKALQLNKMAFSCEAGQTRVLKVVASNAVDDPASLTVTWSSSDAAIAAVDGAGVVTAKAKGTAVISAATTVGGSSFVSECLVVVTNDRVEVRADDPARLQSAHNYADGSTDVWAWHQDRAVGAQVVFDDRCALEDGFDFVELRGADDRLIGRYTGTELAGLSLWIEGDTFTVRLLSDESGTDWGFAVVSITPKVAESDAPAGPEAPTGTAPASTEPVSPEASGPATGTAPDVPMGVEDPADMGQSYVKVPDFFGMSLWDARDLAWTLGLGCDDVWQYSDWAESGMVIWQNVDAGTIVQPGAGVVLTVSAGPELVTVSDVCGINWEDAKWQLESLGLGVDYYWEWSEGAGIDEVIWQSYAAGERVAPGSRVTIAISSGPEPSYFTMSDYSGAWYEEAYYDLLWRGVNVVINDDIWAEVPEDEGRVYWTDPPAGWTVEVGSTVTLYVTRFMDGTPVAMG